MTRTRGLEVISKSDIHAINAPLVYPALFDNVSAVIYTMKTQKSLTSKEEIVKQEETNGKQDLQRKIGGQLAKKKGDEFISLTYSKVCFAFGFSISIIVTFLLSSAQLFASTISGTAWFLCIRWNT